MEEQDESMKKLFERERELQTKERIIEDRMREMSEDARFLREEGIRIHDLMEREKKIVLANEKLNEKAKLVDAKLEAVNKEKAVISTLISKEKEIDERLARTNERESTLAQLQGQILSKVHSLARMQVDIQDKKAIVEDYVKDLHDKVRSLERYIEGKKEEEKLLLQHMSLEDARRLSTVEQAMLLSQKERDLLSIKNAVEGRISDLERFSDKLSKEKDFVQKLKDDAKKISDQHTALSIAKGEIENQRRELDDNKSLHSEALLHKEKALQELKDSIGESIRGLSQREELLLRKEKLLEELDYAIDEKLLLVKKEGTRIGKLKEDLDIRSQKLVQETRLYEKKLDHLKSRLDDLAFFEDEVNKKVDEQERKFKTKLAVLKKEFGERLQSKAFYLDATMQKRDAFLTDREYKLEKEFQEKKDIIESMKRELAMVMKDLEEKISILRKEQVQMSNLKFELVDNAPDMHNKMSIMENRLEALSREWNEKQKELNRRQALIKEYSDQLIPLSKEITDDIKVLEEKENTVLSSYKEVEKERDILYTQEEAIDKKYSKLKATDDDIVRKEQEINSIKNIIRDEEQMLRKELISVGKAEEIRKKLPKLKSSYRRIMKKVEEVNTDAMAKYVSLRDKERELEKREATLKAQKDKLNILLMKFEAQKSAFEKLKEESIFKLIKEEIPVNEEQVDNMPDAESMIKDMLVSVRELINQRRISEATSILTKIEDEFRKMSGPDLGEIGYEIMELKTDIKLSLL